MVASMATAARAPRICQVCQELMPRRSANQQTRPATAIPLPTPENTQPAWSDLPMALRRARQSEAVTTNTQALAIPAIDLQDIQYDHVLIQPMSAVVSATTNKPSLSSVAAFQCRNDADSAPAKYPR